MMTTTFTAFETRIANAVIRNIEKQLEYNDNFIAVDIHMKNPLPSTGKKWSVYCEANVFGGFGGDIRIENIRFYYTEERVYIGFRGLNVANIIKKIERYFNE